MLSEFGRRYLSTPIGRPIARFLSRAGISPNQLTVAGFAFALTSAICFGNGNFILGGILLLLSGVMDLLDGELAKERREVTDWGAYLDSVMDRYSDTIVLLGLAWYFTQAKDPLYVLLVSLVIAGALLVSYTKARAESIIGDFSCGLMERPERIILLAIGTFIPGGMKPVLWILVLLIHFTAFHRVFYTWRKIRKETDSEKGIHR
jgi:phosphatidylglycerophosphate synthase